MISLSIGSIIDIFFIIYQLQNIMSIIMKNNFFFFLTINFYGCEKMSCP